MSALTACAYHETDDGPKKLEYLAGLPIGHVVQAFLFAGLYKHCLSVSLCGQFAVKSNRSRT